MVIRWSIRGIMHEILYKLIISSQKCNGEKSKMLDLQPFSDVSHLIFVFRADWQSLTVYENLIVVEVDILN